MFRGVRNVGGESKGDLACPFSPSAFVSVDLRNSLIGGSCRGATRGAQRFRVN